MAYLSMGQAMREAAEWVGLDMYIITLRREVTSTCACGIGEEPEAKSERDWGQKPNWGTESPGPEQARN